jgi:hypothetical protein
VAWLQTAVFNVTILEADESLIRAAKGVVNELVAEATDGSGQLLPYVLVRHTNANTDGVLMN